MYDKVTYGHEYRIADPRWMFFRGLSLACLAITKRNAQDFRLRLVSYYSSPIHFSTFISDGV